MKKINCLIIDDERLARAELRSMLREFSHLEVLDEAANAIDAKVKIEALNPDVIFLDIQMPGQSGIDFISTLGICPVVIFVTAFDQFAIKAFELNALDYLLKPISPERLASSIQRICDSLSSKPISTGDYKDRLFVSAGKRMKFIQIDEVDHIESLGNYARIFYSEEKGLIKTSLHILESQLNPDLFFRISRTAIINVDRIDEIIQEDKILKVILKSGWIGWMSERKSIAFKRRLLKEN